MKGQESLPFTTIEATTTTIIILTIALGTQGFTNNIVKEEALSIKNDRVKNTVISFSQAPKGFVELNMEGYSIKVNGNNVSMNYSDKNTTRKINASYIDSTLSGPSNFKEINGSLCINKTSSTIDIRPVKC